MILKSFFLGNYPGVWFLMLSIWCLTVSYGKGYMEICLLLPQDWLLRGKGKIRHLKGTCSSVFLVQFYSDSGVYYPRSLFLDISLTLRLLLTTLLGNTPNREESISFHKKVSLTCWMSTSEFSVLVLLPRRNTEEVVGQAPGKAQFILSQR